MGDPASHRSRTPGLTVSEPLDRSDSSYTTCSIRFNVPDATPSSTYHSYQAVSPDEPDFEYVESDPDAPETPPFPFLANPFPPSVYPKRSIVERRKTNNLSLRIPETGRRFSTKKLKNFKDYGLSLPERACMWVYNKVKQLSKTRVTHTFLLLLLIGYSLLGGLLFQWIEGNDETVEIRDVFEGRQELVGYVKRLVNTIPDLESTNQRIAFKKNLTEAFQKYESSVRENFNHNSKMERGVDELNWEFWSSVFFCCTIYTTIGYGHISPSTTHGRALSILYALIGLPLFLIVLTDFGKMFTRAIKYLWSFVRRLYYTGTCRKIRNTETAKGIKEMVRRASRYDIGVNLEIGKSSESVCSPATTFEVDDEFNLPVSIALLILLAYIFIGAGIFHLWEGWTFFESFYFVFVSMATIGFGDFVPKNQKNMIASVIFLAFGLSLTSMCINVVREKLVDSFVHASAKLSQKVGLGLEIDPRILGDQPAVHKPIQK